MPKRKPKKKPGKKAIQNAVRRCKGNVTKAAEELKICRLTIYNKLGADGIQEIQDDIDAQLVEIAREKAFEEVEAGNKQMIKLVLTTRGGYVEDKTINANLTGEYTVNVKHSVI